MKTNDAPYKYDSVNRIQDQRECIHPWWVHPVILDQQIQKDMENHYLNSDLAGKTVVFTGGTDGMFQLRQSWIVQEPRNLAGDIDRHGLMHQATEWCLLLQESFCHSFVVKASNRVFPFSFCL